MTTGYPPAALVSIGIAAIGDAPWAFVESLWTLQRPTSAPLRLLRSGPLAVDVARNEVVRAFLETTTDRWLLMVDSDAVLHPGTLLRLMSHDVPVVSALAFQRYGPLLPTVMQGWSKEQGGYRVCIDETHDWLADHPELAQMGPALLKKAPADSLVEVDATGCHCLLLRRDVLEALPEPWFQGDQKRRHAREDIFFCAQVRQAGYQVLVDRSVVAGHLYGDRPLGGLDFLVWKSVSEFEPAPVGANMTEER